MVPTSKKNNRKTYVAKAAARVVSRGGGDSSTSGIIRSGIVRKRLEKPKSDIKIENGGE